LITPLLIEKLIFEYLKKMLLNKVVDSTTICFVLYY